MQIGRYKLWFNGRRHFCGFQIFGIPIIGKVGRKKQVETIFDLAIGGFYSYWIWRFTLTIFQK